MKDSRKFSVKNLIGRRGALAAVSIVLALALVVSVFAGVIPILLTASAAAGSGLLTSLNGENTIPSGYTAINVPAGTRVMEPDDYNNADAVPSLSDDGISAFDFLIFANRFAATVHTCGNIAVNELGYEVLGTTGAPEFGSRAAHDLDVERVSYIGNFNSWTSASTADYFVFGPNVKISGRENGPITYGNNGNMIGNDHNGDILGNMYLEDVKGSFINIGDELVEAEDYMRYLIWLQKKTNKSSEPVKVELGNSEYTMVQYLNKNVIKNNGVIDFTPYTGADTIVVDLSAADAQKLLKGNIDMKGTAGKRIVFNVNVDKDSGGEFKLNDTTMTVDGLKNCEEVANYDNNVLWNFYELDANGVPYSYDGIVNVNGTWIGTINAPKATVRCYAGVNGSIIADKVTSRNETHKSDYTGERVRKTSVSVPVHKIWDDDPNVRPATITLRLMRNKELYKTVQVDENSSSKNDTYNWYYTFTELPATDANGKTYQYKVEEVPVPGYETSQINNTIYNSSDYTPVYYALTVNKTDNAGNPLEDAVFELTGTGGNLSGAAPSSGGYKSGTFSASATKVTWTSSGNPITISNLPKGNYTVTEVTAPRGYMKASPVSVDLTSGNREITVRNSPLSVNFKKLNGSAGNAFLPGSTFTLKPVGISFNYNSSGVKVDGAASSDKHSGSIEWVSGHGAVTVSGIPAGTYTLTEDASPEGYDIAAPVTLVLNDDGTVMVAGSQTNSVEVTDYLLPVNEKKYTLNINKKDEFGTNLPDAQLELISVAGKDLEDDYEVEVSGAKNASVSDDSVSLITGSGAVSISGLPGGSYILRELSAPQNYCAAKDIAITLNDSTADSNAIVSAEMTDYMLSVNFLKENSITGNGISGATFKIEEVIGSSYEPLYSDCQTNGDDNLIPLPHAGTYVITETAAPAGYFTAAPIWFTIDKYGTITDSNAPSWTAGTVTMVDEPCTLNIQKKYWNDDKDNAIEDDETGPLSGAVLVLTATSDTVDLSDVTGILPIEVAAKSGDRVTAIRWTSGIEPNTLYSLPNGSYTLTEESAPEGYEPASGISFKYTYSGNTTSLSEITTLDPQNSIQNQPIHGKDSDGVYVGLYNKKIIRHSLEILKVDEDAPAQGLAGAQFAVYPKNPDTDAGIFADGEGCFYFESAATAQKLTLPDGGYYLVELSAPAGYERLANPVPFTVNDGAITPAGPTNVGTVSASTMPKSVLANKVGTLTGNFNSDTAEYLVVDLSGVDSKVTSVSVKRASTSSSTAEAAGFAENGTITCGSFSVDSSDTTVLNADVTDDSTGTTGKYLVIAKIKNSAADSDMNFQSVTVNFENGGSAEIPSADWGYEPASSTSGGGTSSSGISASVITYSDLNSRIFSHLDATGLSDPLKLGTNGDSFVLLSMMNAKNDISKIEFELSSAVQGSYLVLQEFSRNSSSENFGSGTRHDHLNIYGTTCDVWNNPNILGSNSERYFVFAQLSGNDVITPVISKITVNFKDGTQTTAEVGGGTPETPVDPTSVDVIVPASGSVTPGTDTEPPKLVIPNKLIPEDKRYTHGFKVQKTDDSTSANPIAVTASFAVYRSSDDTQLKFSEQTSGTPGKYVYDPSGVAQGSVATVTTDSSGLLEITGLEEGSYYLYETAAPTNYLLSSARLDVTLPTDDDTIQKFANTEIKGELLITKLDDNGGTRRGAEFTLYDEGNNPVTVTQGDTVGYYVYDASSSVTTIVTGDSGHITVEGLPMGKYYAIETKAPVGCVITDTDKLPLILDESGSSSRGFELTSSAPTFAFTVTDNAYQAKFEKVDAADTDVLLEGAVFELAPTAMSTDPAHPVFADVTASLETEHDIKYDYDQNNNYVITGIHEKLIWTTTKDAPNIIYGLPAGTYTLTEVTAPAGYSVIPAPVTVTVTTDGKVNGGDTITVADTADTGSVTLFKYDSVSGAVLKDAKFVLKCGDKYVVRNTTTGAITFVSDKSDATVFITDRDGKITVPGLPFGKTYTFEETEAPTGYRLSAQGINAEVRANDLNKEVSAYNDRLPAKITLNKTDTAGAPVDGAGFVFCRIENSTPLYIKVGSDSVSFTESITEATEYTTRNGGVISIENLFPWGYDYYAVEVTVPDGYLQPEDNMTALTCDGVVNYSATVRNSKGGLSISKQDSSSHPLAGAAFSLTKSDNASLEGVSVTVGGQEVGTLSTDKKTVTWLSGASPASIGNIPAGTYTLTETSAPAGYAVAPSKTFTVGTDGKIRIGSDVQANDTVIVTDYPTEITISKKAEGAIAELPDAYLEIVPVDMIDLSNVVVPAGVTRTAGKISWKTGSSAVTLEKLPAGSYTLTETSAPAGYAVAPSKTFTVGADGIVRIGTAVQDNNTLVMTDVPTEVKISKKALGAGTELKGAALKITPDSTATDLSNVVVPAGVTRTASQITWTSGDNEITIGMLPVGAYTLTEVTAPDGYEVAEAMKFTIEADGTVKVGGQTVNSKTVLMEDVPIKYATLSVSKIDMANNKELPGAKLVVKDSKGAEIESWTSTSSKYTLKNKLPAGTYTLTETIAPTGYSVAETITFVVDKDGKITVGGKDVTANTIVMEDAANTYSVYISKVELGGGDELPGAELTVTDSSGKTVDEWTSTDEKHLIEKLPAGTYTLTEVTAPNGYKIAEEMTFTIDNAGVVKVGGKTVTANTVVMKDAPNELVISKQAVGGGSELEGAVLRIVPLDKKTDLSDVDVPDGVTVEKNLISWTSGKKALTIGRIPDGIYTFTEITAPNGYDVAETIYIKVDEDGVSCAKESEYKDENTKWNTVKNDTVIMYDSATVLPPDSKNGSFSFIKQSNLGKALSGAEFTLVKGTETKKATSGADGKVVFADIAPGTYTLSESKAPAGYVKSAGSMLVTVSSEGTVSCKDGTGKALTVSDIEKLFINTLTPVNNNKTITENKPVNLYDELVKNNDSIKDVPLNWTTSDPNVAEVDSSGNVTFKKPGNVTITAKKDDNVVGSFTLGVADSAVSTAYTTTQAQTGSAQNVTIPAATPTTTAVVQVPSTSENNSPDTGDRINIIAFAVSLIAVAAVTAKTVFQNRGKKREDAE